MGKRLLAIEKTVIYNNFLKGCDAPNIYIYFLVERLDHSKNKKISSRNVTCLKVYFSCTLNQSYSYKKEIMITFFFSKRILNPVTLSFFLDTLVNMRTLKL